MDLRQLRAFVTVAKYSSVTKAAEALHLTQPAVSGQLRALEEELQLRLLNRTTSSVTLTPTGQELLGLAEDALDGFGRFSHTARMLRGKIEGQLRIGIVMIEPHALRLGELLADLVKESPGLSIDLQVGRTGWMHDGLRSAEIDAAILVGRTRPVGTRCVTLETMTFRLVIPSAWRSRFATMALDELSDVPWIRMARRSSHQEILNELLSGASIKPRETVEVDHELMMLELVAAGVGVGLIREHLVHKAEPAGSVVFFGDHKVTAQLTFEYPEGRSNDPQILEVIAALRRVWGCPAP